jgi:uncharacterized membrane protein YoaK (UPF0700 family)
VNGHRSGDRRRLARKDYMYTPSDPTNVGLSVVAASVLTAAGGSMDAWVYMDHGHVFANAQTGNVVLFGIHVAAGDFTAAARHVPSIMAFILGLVSSRLSGASLKKAGLNSRNVRLTVECVLLVALALIANRLPNGAVTASVGFIAAVQITSLSHIGDVTFNTGMTTGNLLSAFSAASAVLYEPASKKDRTRAIALGFMCLAFGFRWGRYITFWRPNVIRHGRHGWSRIPFDVANSRPDSVFPGTSWSRIVHPA